MDDWANISDDEDIDDGDDEEEDDEKTKDGEQIYLIDWSKLVQCRLVEDGILVLRKAHVFCPVSRNSLEKPLRQSNWQWYLLNLLK